MARLMMTALRHAGFEPRLLSNLRMYDAGDAHRQRRLVRLAHRCAERQLHLAPQAPVEAVFTYHCYHKAPDVLGRRLSATWDVPYLIAEASISPRRSHGPWGVGYAEAMHAIRAADAVLAMSSVDLKGLAPHLAPATALLTFPPFTACLPALPERVPLVGRSIRLLTVAMMRPGAKAKSYELLTAALAQCVAQPWEWTVVGDGEERPAIEAAVAPFANRVRFLGEVQPVALASLYADADLLVWPAVDEAYGMALLEAQAHGVPVLAGATHGTPDIIVDGTTGKLVPIGDVDAFARALGELLAQPEHLAVMGDAAYHHVRSAHSLDRAAQRLTEALAIAKDRHRQCAEGRT